MTNDASSYVQCSSLVETSWACCNQEMHVYRSMSGAVVIITDFFFKRKINFQGGSDIIKTEKSHKNALFRTIKSFEFSSVIEDCLKR